MVARGLVLCVFRELCEYFRRHVGVCSLDDFDSRLDLNFGDHVVIVLAMVSQTGTDVDFGGLLIERRIPQLDLYQAGDDADTRTAAAVQDADEFGVHVLVAFKGAFPAVEGDHTSRTADADVVHGVFAADNQNLFHVILPVGESYRKAEGENSFSLHESRKQFLELYAVFFPGSRGDRGEYAETFAVIMEILVAHGAEYGGIDHGVDFHDFGHERQRLEVRQVFIHDDEFRGEVLDLCQCVGTVFHEE